MRHIARKRPGGQNPLPEAPPGVTVDNGLFVGSKGINIMWPYLGPTMNGANTAFNTNPFTNPSDFNTHVPPSTLTYLKEIGFDHIRLNVATNPWQEAVNAGDFNRVNYLFSILDEGINAIFASGLNILLDMHPAYYGPSRYQPPNLLSVAANNSAWLEYVEVVRQFSRYYASRAPSNRFALELFNEPTDAGSINGLWTTRQYPMWQAARAEMPYHTLVVTNDQWSSIDRLILLNPNDFDLRTQFAMHPYIPALFTTQGYPNGYNTWVKNLNYPPGSGGQTKAQVISAMTTAVNNDPAVSNKSATISAQTTEIGYYFDVPLNYSWMLGEFNKMLTWANQYGISTNRIWATEYGVTRTDVVTGITGAPQTSRERYISDVTDALDASGLRRSVFALDASDYGLTDDSGTNIGSIEAEFITGLNLS